MTHYSLHGDFHFEEVDISVAVIRPMQTVLACDECPYDCPHFI